VDGGPVTGAVPARPTRPRGDLLHGDALDRADVDALVAAGATLAEGTAADLLALGEVGIGNTTVAAALVAALTGRDPAELVGRGVGADTAMVRRKREVVAGAVGRLPATGRDADPLALLAAVGGPEVAVLTGVVLGGARSGRAVVLDGLATGVAALVAARVEPAVTASLVAGQRSREPAAAVVLTELGLEPLLDLRLRAGEGVGAVLAVHLLRGAGVARRSTARVTDAAAPPTG
jgi:nicotinate-nucleotide--dimethylbenzimidazole phosphoribosyltransferase